MKGIFALIPMIALASLPLFAQGNSPKADGNAKAATVTVVLKDKFPQAHIAALIRRHPGAGGGYTVAIARADAKPEILWAALSAVAMARLNSAATSKWTMVFPRTLKYPPPKPDEMGRMTSALGELMVAEARAVPGVGHVPSIVVKLPPACATCTK